MKKYLLIPLILLCFNANARLESLYLHSEGGFDTLCLENGIWENCGSTTSAAPIGEYQYLFHSKTTQESIAIGYDETDELTSFVAACRATPGANWHDCTPNAADIPEGSYSSYTRPSDGDNGTLMVVGRGEYASIIAACRDAAGTWRDCSPRENTDGFDPEAVSYANNQWMVLAGAVLRDDQNGITYTPAFCMNPNGDWANCDLKVQDPTGDFYSNVSDFTTVQYVPASQEWVAVGTGDDEEHGEVFKSICRKNNETFWHDCTNGIFLSNTTDHRLVQNNQGELLQLNYFISGISLASQTLCKKPNAGWTDCSGSLTQKNQVYTGVTTDAAGTWVLVGYHSSTNLSENLAHLTATQVDNDWEILRQEPATPTSILADVMLVE